MLPKVDPTTTDAWEKLEDLYFDAEGIQIKELFEKDPGRFDKFSLRFGDILVDFSKNMLNAEVFDALMQLAEECRLTDAG